MELPTYKNLLTHHNYWASYKMAIDHVKLLHGLEKEDFLKTFHQSLCEAIQKETELHKKKDAGAVLAQLFEDYQISFSNLSLENKCYVFLRLYQKKGSIIYNLPLDEFIGFIDFFNQKDNIYLVKINLSYYGQKEELKFTPSSYRILGQYLSKSKQSMKGVLELFNDEIKTFKTTKQFPLEKLPSFSSILYQTLTFSLLHDTEEFFFNCWIPARHSLVLSIHQFAQCYINNGGTTEKVLELEEILIKLKKSHKHDINNFFDQGDFITIMLDYTKASDQAKELKKEFGSIQNENQVKIL